MAKTILIGPPVIFGPEPSFIIRFPDWKGQRGNDVNVAGFFTVHGISIFFSHCLKFCYFSYLLTYPNDDAGF